MHTVEYSFQRDRVSVGVTMAVSDSNRDEADRLKSWPRVGVSLELAAAVGQVGTTYLGEGAPRSATDYCCCLHATPASAARDLRVALPHTCDSVLTLPRSQTARFPAARLSPHPRAS